MDGCVIRECHKDAVVMAWYESPPFSCEGRGVPTTVPMHLCEEHADLIAAAVERCLHGES